MKKITLARVGLAVFFFGFLPGLVLAEEKVTLLFFWGEGCPRSPQEALHCGCVVIAYDVLGNREYLLPNFSGLPIPRGNVGEMARQVVRVLSDSNHKERLRQQGLALVRAMFSPETCWPFVRDFLGLRESSHHARLDVGTLPRDTIERLLGAPAYIGEEEIAVLSRYAHTSTRLLEIGAAFGLILGVGLGGWMLLGALQGRSRAEERLRRASGAFADLLQERFAEWGLTPSEKDVALFAIKGMSTAEIATMRSTSEGTVKAQLSAVYHKSGINTRSELLAFFMDEFLDYAAVDETPASGEKATTNTASAFSRRPTVRCTPTT